MSLKLHITSPLPQQYLTDEPGIGGAIKQRPEDFLVDEIPLYDPCGEGERLYLLVESKRVAHSELIATVRRYFQVREHAIGYAGMKDKIGVTRQMLSVYLPGVDDGDVGNIDLGHERIGVLWAARHRNKLRRGHLRGNRFSIRIRAVAPTSAPGVLRTLKTLEQTGVPNYFGPQRFGYRANNHLLGALLLAGDFDGFVRELVGTGYTPFPDYQRQRRELADAGAYARALSMWTTADRAERRVLQALVDGADAKQACLSVKKQMREFYISAFQSAIFNGVLDQRITDGTMSTLHRGDVAWKHDSRAVFAVTDDEFDSRELHERVQQFELSPSGPLFGRKMVEAAGAIGELEQRVFEATGLPHEQFMQSAFVPDGQRRALRMPIENIEVEGGVDEHGGYVRTAFDLPRGTYATIALREVMKNDVDAEFADEQPLRIEAGA